ncbi:MAG: uroporphyrinogen decarboxylase family protein [Anaerolineales bacterium]
MRASHRERIQVALSGQKPDEIPIALWRHFPVEDQDPHALAEATLRFQLEFDFDLVKVTPSSSFSVRDWGVEDVWEGDPEGTRRYIRPVVENPTGWSKLRRLDPGRGALRRQLMCLGEIKTRLGRETPVLQTVFNPLAQARHLAGDAVLIEHIRRWPEAVLEGLERITASTEKFVTACLERSEDGIFFAVQHASRRLLSPEEYRQFGRPFDLRVLEAAKGGWLNLLHLHGDGVLFEDLCDYPVQVINWHDREAGPSLKDGHKLSGKVVCGGMRQWATMVCGDPKRVWEEAADAVHQMAGRDLILGTGCVCPVVTPWVNLRAAVDYSRKQAPRPRSKGSSRRLSIAA